MTWKQGNLAKATKSISSQPVAHNLKLEAVPDSSVLAEKPTKEKATLHAGLLLSSFSFSMAQTSTSIAPHHVDPISVSFDHIPMPSPKGKVRKRGMAAVRERERERERGKLGHRNSCSFSKASSKHYL